MSSVVRFPYPAHKWFEILDDSLDGFPCQIFAGDIIECQLNTSLGLGFPYVLMLGGLILIKYVECRRGISVLFPTNPSYDIKAVGTSEIEIIGHAVRVYHNGQWHNLIESRIPPRMLRDHWLRWAIEEAS